MATSGSSDYTVTATQILTEALELIGVLAAGDTAETNDITSGLVSLNILVKGMQADKIYLRFIDEQTLSLVDGTAAYDADTGTLRVLNAWLRISNTDYPLEMVDRETYDSFANKSAENTPSHIFVDYAPAVPKVYCYPAPDTSYTLHYRRERSVEDFDATSNNADFPVKALDMLTMGAAWRYACKFNLPLSERQYWEVQYERAKNVYRAGDTERHSRQIVAPNNIV